MFVNRRIEKKKKKGKKEREDNSLSSLFDPMVEKEGNGDV